MKLDKFKISALAVPIMCACGAEDDFDLYDTASGALSAFNAAALNAAALNGAALNGAVLNAKVLNAAALNGAALNGAALNAAVLNGAVLNATALNGTVLNGADLIGSTWTGMVSDGTTIALRIDSVAEGPGADVMRYGVSYQTADGWTPLCGLSSDGSAVLAIPVAGSFNYGVNVPGGGSYTPSSTTFTFGCVNAAAGKCVLFGYKPWTHPDHYAACTRLVRADYCGDGRSWTQTGTPINLYDNVGIQLDTEAWTVEAAWAPQGATCVSTSNDARFTLNGGRRPECFGALQSRSCGQTFSPGTFLIDEYREGTMAPRFTSTVMAR